MTTREQFEYLDGILREHGFEFKCYSLITNTPTLYVAWRDEKGEHFLPWLECPKWSKYPDDELERLLKEFQNKLKYTNRFKLTLRNLRSFPPEIVELTFPPFDNVQELKMKMELGAKITVIME